jgi:pSer/pThr/pTyr-binding forkhead associated (FHA) protein
LERRRGKKMSAVLSAAPVLRLRSGPFAGTAYELRATLRLGRHPYNEVSVADPSVSRYHCWITYRDGSAWIEDLASANGTRVNGVRVLERRVLNPGDLIRVGNTEFRLGEEAA